MATLPHQKSAAREWVEAIGGFFLGPLLFLLPFCLIGAIAGALWRFGHSLR